jgi:transposase InsO family protein
MNETMRADEALFKHALLGPVLFEKLSRGQLRRKLREIAAQTHYDQNGTARTFSWRTLEDWLYQIKGEGFESLKRRKRRDAGACRALTPEVAELVLELKKEDPGRSAPMILEQLEDAGRIQKDSISVSTIQRHLRRRGLSGPAMEVSRGERFRFQAELVNALWQGDAVHGPKLVNPRTGQLETVKTFALIDDRSRLIVNIVAGFRETEAAFLAVLHGAIARRGLPRTLYLDNGSSFIGRDLKLACAQVGTRLLHSHPYEASARGKVERLFRTLRAQVLRRLDPKRVKTLDDLNVRLMAWAEGKYNVRPHAALNGRTPLEVWEQGADDVCWPKDSSGLAGAFRGEAVRWAKNDATVSFEGTTYEVPGHLRRRSVTLRYSFLDPARVSVVDGVAEVPIKKVDPIGNARRRRHTAPLAPSGSPVSTGLNPVEQTLDRISGRLATRKGEGR